MSESEYIRREMEDHPEPEYLSDLRILRRFVQNVSFGYRAPEDVVFQTLKKRYPLAYSAFGEERKREVMEKFKASPYLEGQARTYPNNPDKERYLADLKRLRYIMMLFNLGYGSREMAMLKVNSKRRYPEALAAFEKELEDVWAR
jgi:hypothetical protein